MRILLVEDHLPLAESVAQALRGAGLTVDVLHDVRGIAFTEFQKEDVVRHPLVARIVSAYEAHAAALEEKIGTPNDN